MQLNLRAKRIAKGESVEQFALAFKVKTEAVYSWERGDYGPSLKIFRAVAARYGVKPERLAQHFEDRKKERRETRERGQLAMSAK